jgi:murein DD-endopeptidase MepM/ murein hydrolase activator NlpD
VLLFVLTAAIEISLRSRSVRPGELVVVTMTLPADDGQVHVRAFDRDVPAFRVGDRTWRALLGIDLDAAPGAYAVEVIAGDAHATRPLVVGRKVFPTRRLSVDEAFVTPPASVQERIDREAELLAATWESSAPERLWHDPFVRPVTAPANSAFGTRNPHGGADFLSPAGTPIQAPNAGRIVVARLLYFSGNTVIVDHGLGLFSMLAHLSSIDVREGDVVSAGQVVGKVGATGRVTGPHLHWAVRAGGARVDPLALLALLGGSDAPQ